MTPELCLVLKAVASEKEAQGSLGKTRFPVNRPWVCPVNGTWSKPGPPCRLHVEWWEGKPTKAKPTYELIFLMDHLGPNATQ